MTALVWDLTQERFYETGVDRGVLYVEGLDPVAWSGLHSIISSPDGGIANGYYLDGVKYANIASDEEFAGRIEAYYSPAEFDLCDGSTPVASGLNYGAQTRRSFSFTFRTQINTAGSSGYLVHIVYNAMATPTNKDYPTIDSDLDIEPLVWDFTTTNVNFPNHSPAAHFVLDSRKLDPAILLTIENLLYGSDENAPRLPTMSDFVDLFDITVLGTYGVSTYGVGIYG